MKFALNGALTIGTLDGANVEIRDAVGPENFFLFGLDSRRGERAVRARLRPARLHRAQPGAARRRSTLIESGFFSLGERERYRPIVDNLRYHDPYMVCADFDAYVAREARGGRSSTAIARDWSRRALFNIAGASRFSSDATIRQYATRDLGPRADGAEPGADRASPV